jgi:hypothetical protein
MPLVFYINNAHGFDRRSKTKVGEPNISRRHLSTLITSYLIVAMLFSVLISGCGTDSEPILQSTSAASWPAQLSFAQAQIDNLSPGAVAMWVTSSFESCSRDIDSPEVISFIFVYPSGRRARVDIRDTNPPTLVVVEPEYDILNPPVAKEELEEYAKAIASVKLSPRQACQTVLPNVPNGKAEAIIGVNMFLDRDQNKSRTFGLPSIWSVAYVTKQGPSYDFVVSPTDGAILKQDVSGP